MSNEYRNNHYVPVWYQRRFLAPRRASNELFRLDLEPGHFTDPRGVVHPRRALRRLGPRRCFARTDLYTRQVGSLSNRDIEKYFFGQIDDRGRAAVSYFAEFVHPSADDDAFRNMLLYMTTQKLRTPRGLGWLAQHAPMDSRERLLARMMRLQRIFGAIWAECIWQIADASQSSTKFIVSDHPVTVYNRECGPRSQMCRGYGDPDIWLQGSHTLFPLSLDRVLILTNLSWVRNPYQSAKGPRPNPNPARGAIFKFMDVQTMRMLSEREVIEMNFILKSRAHRYIAAGEEGWLYPDEHVSKSQWSEFGHGYLLMPDPRPVHLGGEVIWGNEDGTGGALDVYGRRPWDPDYRKEDKSPLERRTLYRFKGEFARLFGPMRRGRSFTMSQLDPECDSAEMHAYFLRQEARMRRRAR